MKSDDLLCKNLQNLFNIPLCLFLTNVSLIVYDLKSVGTLEIKFVAPIPEQIATTTMHFLKATMGGLLRCFDTVTLNF